MSVFAIIKLTSRTWKVAEAANGTQTIELFNQHKLTGHHSRMPARSGEIRV